MKTKETAPDEREQRIEEKLNRLLECRYAGTNEEFNQLFDELHYLERVPLMKIWDRLTNSVSLK